MQDDAGVVVGVRAQKADGSECTVKAAKGVVLAAGAFTYNDEMLADYAPEALLCAGRTGVPSDRGDGIKMGMRVGAATRSMSRLNVSEFMYQYGDMAAGVMVNRNGLRFLSEDWYGAWIVPAATADTLEELVAQLDVPGQNVLDSIARYNALCEKGEDTDFGKDVMYMKPVATPPFYAFDARPGAMPWVHTCGGLKIDAKAQVIDVDGNVISGLYAAGRTACGIYGEYPASGSSVADCITFGRIAGTEAAAR